MRIGELGAIHKDGEVIVRQGESADCMYVIQAGRVEVVIEQPPAEVRLGVLEAGDVFGEMALFNKAPRSATVRAIGETRVLKVDKRGFLSRVHQDPSLAFRMLQKLADRVSAADAEIARLSTRGHRLPPR